MEYDIYLSYGVIPEPSDTSYTVRNGLLPVRFHVDIRPTSERRRVQIPVFKLNPAGIGLKAIVHDEKVTSGERYKTLERPEPTEDEVIEWVRSKPDVRRIETTERVGTVKLDNTRVCSAAARLGCPWFDSAVGLVR